MNGGSDYKLLDSEMGKPPLLHISTTVASLLVSLLILIVTLLFLGKMSSDVVENDRLRARIQLEDIHTNLHYFFGSQSTLGELLALHSTSSSQNDTTINIDTLTESFELLADRNPALRFATIVRDGKEVRTWSASHREAELPITQVLHESCLERMDNAASICGPREIEGLGPWVISIRPLDERTALALAYDFWELLMQMGYRDIPPTLSVCFRSWDTRGEELFVCDDQKVFERSFVSIPINHSQLQWEIGIFPKQGWKWWNSSLTVTMIFGLLLAISIGLLTYRIGLRLSRVSRELMYDQLTGTLNKRAFTRTLASEIATNESSEGGFVLAIVDIDDFKHLNDRCGHLAGDRALSILADQIKKSLRTNDVVARFGGDEFVLIFRHLGPKETSSKIVQTIFQRIVKSTLPSTINFEAIHISMGVAFWPEDARDAQDLFAVADEQLYRAKSLGKRRLCIKDNPET